MELKTVKRPKTLKPFDWQGFNALQATLLFPCERGVKEPRRRITTSL
jgi:hypothetical protein